MFSGAFQRSDRPASGDAGSSAAARQLAPESEPETERKTKPGGHPVSSASDIDAAGCSDDALSRTGMHQATRNAAKARRPIGGLGFKGDCDVGQHTHAFNRRRFAEQLAQPDRVFVLYERRSRIHRSSISNPGDRDHTRALSPDFSARICPLLHRRWPGPPSYKGDVQGRTPGTERRSLAPRRRSRGGIAEGRTWSASNRGFFMDARQLRSRPSSSLRPSLLESFGDRLIWSSTRRSSGLASFHYRLTEETVRSPRCVLALLRPPFTASAPDRLAPTAAYNSRHRRSSPQGHVGPPPTHHAVGRPTQCPRLHT